MRAALLTGFGEPLVIEEVAKPEPGPGEIVLKIAGAGVCHSDVHTARGEVPESWVPPFPFILGHENGGWVDAIGPGVSMVSEGDAVVVYPSPGDGACSYCITGNEQFCADQSRWNGTFVAGGYAEYMKVYSERHLVKLDRLDPRFAATLTDAGFTGYGAVKKALPFIDHETPVLVIGIGGLGGYAVKYLDLMTGSPIIAVDVAPAKRDRAREYGADHTLDGNDPDLHARIMELTDGRGVCAAFDFVGSDTTLNTIVTGTRPGGKATQIGLAGGTANIKVTSDFRFGVTFEAHLGGTIKNLRDVIALFEHGEVSAIPTTYGTLEEVNEILARLDDGDIDGRAVITP